MDLGDCLEELVFLRQGDVRLSFNAFQGTGFVAALYDDPKLQAGGLAVLLAPHEMEALHRGAQEAAANAPTEEHGFKQFYTVQPRPLVVQGLVSRLDGQLWMSFIWSQWRQVVGTTILPLEGSMQALDHVMSYVRSVPDRPEELVFERLLGPASFQASGRSFSEIGTLSHADNDRHESMALEELLPQDRIRVFSAGRGKSALWLRLELLSRPRPVLTDQQRLPRAGMEALAPLCEQGEAADEASLSGDYDGARAMYQPLLGQSEPWFIAKARLGAFLNEVRADNLVAAVDILNRSLAPKVLKEGRLSNRDTATWQFASAYIACHGTQQAHEGLMAYINPLQGYVQKYEPSLRPLLLSNWRLELAQIFGPDIPQHALAPWINLRKTCQSLIPGHIRLPLPDRWVDPRPLCVVCRQDSSLTCDAVVDGVPCTTTLCPQCTVKGPDNTDHCPTHRHLIQSKGGWLQKLMGR